VAAQAKVEKAASDGVIAQPTGSVQSNASKGFLLGVREHLGQGGPSPVGDSRKIC